MFDIIWTVIVGFVIGLIARALMPGDQKLGFIMTAVLGIAGSFLANYAGTAMGLYKAGDAAGWIAKVVGALVLLAIYGFVKNKAAAGSGSGEGGA